MSKEAPTRRTAAVILLILAAFGALIILGKVFQFAMLAFSFVFKFLSGGIALVAIGMLIYFLAKKLSKI